MRTGVAYILVKSLRDIKGGDVPGNVALRETLGISGHTNSIITLLLCQHSACMLKLRRLVIVLVQVKNWSLNATEG